MKIYPINYNITLDIDLKNFTYSGEEVISLNIEENTYGITLDCAGLAISKVVLESGQEVKFELVEKEQQLILNFEKGLVLGEQKINIHFAGKLEDKLAGFYTSKYEQDGQTKYIATTQFEAADARSAFPCFDAPEFKATFDISFIIGKELTGIANTSIIEEKELENGKKLIKFAQTPKMSTYILYFGVGEFGFVSDKYNDIEIRVGAVAGKEKYGEFALDFTKKCLTYFEDYFGYKYVLPKLDLIGVPDFGAGAMENWGAITFRETLLLVYPGQTSKASLQRIAEVIAHELAHMWFGNLVTMKWWDNLWLNESFATFMAYKALDEIYPEWDIWTHYVMHTNFTGMDLDSLSSSHPIKVEVKHASEVDEIFDAISYEKGGSVLRMLEGYVSAGAFRDGLREYIKKFAYKNTVESDLWDCIESKSEVSIVSFMQKYINQVGFPMVDVNTRDNAVTLSQKRFLLKGGNKDESSLWEIPMVVQTDSDKFVRCSLSSKKEEVKLDDYNFININSDYTGVYISNYDEKSLELLGDNLSQVSNKDRLGLIHDLFMLARAAEIKVDVFLDFISKYFYTETDHSVLVYILWQLDWIHSTLKDKKSENLLLKYCKRGMDLIGLVPNEEEKPVDGMLRSQIIFSLAQGNDPVVSKFVTESFAAFLEDSTSLEASLRSVVYGQSVWVNSGNYARVLELYKKEESQDEKTKFLRALCFSQNKEDIQKTLEFSLSDEVRFSHLANVIYGLSENKHAQGILMDWVLENWEKLNEKGGGMGMLILKRIMEYTVPKLGIGRTEELRKFFSGERVKGMSMTVEQVFENLGINEAFIKANSKS